MILDDLKNAARYCHLHAGFRQGFEFLQRADLLALAEGRHELLGDRVFALINRDPGRGHEGARLEAHRKYIDIQYLVDGSEEIGWRPTTECRELVEAYDESRDIMFFADCTAHVDPAAGRQVHDLLSRGRARPAGGNGRQRQGRDQSGRLAPLAAGGAHCGPRAGPVVGQPDAAI